MAALNSVTVEVTPVLPEGLQEQIDTAVREAVADVLRTFADRLTTAPTSAPANEPRFQYRQIGGKEGIIDIERPGVWDDYGAISDRPGAAAIDENYIRGQAEALCQQHAAGTLDPTDLAHWDPIPQG
jgi:hypothetical protein